MAYQVAVYCIFCKRPFPSLPRDGRAVTLSQEVMELQGQLSLGPHSCGDLHVEAHRLRSSQGDNQMARDR